MKTNRITALAAIILPLLLVIAQVLGGAPSAQASQPHLSATVNVQANNPQPGSKDAAPNDQTPYHITVQGRLTDSSGNPIIVATNVTFKLYSVASGGSAIFTEGPISITPSSNGLFTYLLGSNTSFNLAAVANFANKLYLGIAVGADAEMSPRFEMTASPYAMSLAPGAVVSGPVNGLFPQEGAINGINTNPNYFSIGVYGRGTTGLSGETYADNLDSFGVNGYNGGVSSSYRHTGVYGGAAIGTGISGATGGPDLRKYGAGVYGESFPSGNNYLNTAGVIGFGFPGSGGVFTGTFTGLVGYAYGTTAGRSGYIDGVDGMTSNSGGSGVFGRSLGAGGEGVWGSAYPGPSTAFGGFFDSYDQGSSHTAVYARGAGHATGGWFTGLGFGMMVKYHGDSDLHPGDVLALDGNNEMVEGVQTLGVVKADASNAGAAVGIAQSRYQVSLADPADTNPMKHDTIQVDDKATTIKAGDLVQIIIAGQAQVKVSGAVKLGDHLAIASNGGVAVSKDASDSIGKVASQPDANGFVTVFVNFK